MTTPYVAYEATANQSDFVVPFPFLNRTHVKVKVNGVPALIMDWPNDSTLRLFSPAPDGTFVEIERETPIDTSLVTFSDGNILNASDLNTAMTQLLYRQQEMSAAYDRNVESAMTRIAAAGGVVLPVDDLMNSIVAELSQNATVENFQQRVGEIDLNASNILTNAQAIIDKGADIASVNLRADTLDSTAASLQTQADGLRTDLTTLTGVVDSLAGGDPGTGIATLIQAEETARIAGDQAIVDTIDLIGAKSGDGLAFIADLNTLKVSPTESLGERFTALSAANSANSASIAAEQTARVNADAAIASDVSLIETRMDTAEADIIAEQTARSDGDAAEAAARGLLEARVTTAEGDIATNAAAIVTEQTARATGDAAEAAARSALTARVDAAEADIATNSAAITSEEIARADGDAAEAAARAVLAAQVTAAEGAIADNAAAIVAEQNARATAISSEASARNALAAVVNTKNRTFRQATAPTATAIGDLWIDSDDNNKSYRWNGNAWEATSDTRIDQNAAAIVTEQNARATAIAAEASARNALEARVTTAESDITDNAAALATEQTTRANADTAIASDVSALTARVTTAEGDIVDNAAAIVTEQNARASAISAEASARNALAARVTTAEGDIAAAESAILTEQTARANGDNALASDMALLGAKNAGGDAWILDENTVQVSGGTTLGTRLSGIDTSIGNANAAIVSEETARINGDNALSSSISTLQTTVDGNTASVSTLQSSVSGLEAKYGVTLDVNGYVTGFAQNNDGQTGVFQILADKFQIVDPAGGANPTALVPFEVSGGIVKIKNAAIDNLDVGKLADGALSANITQNGNWNVGTGKIIWDNGTFMKVSGVGFGTANQFIEWFGPKKDINLCDEASAIQFLKTNGDAYFGGTLSAGVLKNSAQSTSHVSNASIEIGPFGSNGNPIQVVLSYAIESRNSVFYPATTQGQTNWNNAVASWGATASGDTVSASKSISANVVVGLQRNGVSWGTLTITSGSESIGGTRPTGGDPGQLVYVRTFSGSFTKTDSVGGTADRTFTATITTRDAGVVNGAIQFQNLSLISTEN